MATGTLASIGSSPNTGSLSSNLAVSGLASGMNWQSVVTELADAERAPETQWTQQQTTINQQNTAFSTVSANLTTLQSDITTLGTASFYDSRTATTSNANTATATAAADATIGTYDFNISQLATSAQINGASNISHVLAPGGNTNAVTIGTAGFSTPVSPGTFTVNGAQVTIATTDSLQQVFDNIASATGNAVTATYDSTADEITLHSTSSIVLGSAADTSNFLQSAQLYNTGSGTVTSTSALGRVQTNVALPDSDLATTVTDGGSGNGAFTINGVTINFNATTDGIQDVLSRINSSAAGVNASYDPLNNKFILANKTTGDVGITMQDVTGNFLAATGLSTGTLQRGNNLLYQLNGGTQVLQSQSNTITTSSSGISGLSVTALAKGDVTASVAVDTGTISSTIQKFLADYNNAQSYITSQMAVTTASDGTVTAGLFTGDTNANDIATTLRSTTSYVSPATSGVAGIHQLNDLGIETNGQDNTLSLSDASTLTAALTNNLQGVKALFSDPTTGIATQLTTYLNNTIGTNGTLTAHETDLTQQSDNINTQISNLENKITQDSDQWTSEFQAMETATAQTNQELTYLSQGVANGSL